MEFSVFIFKDDNDTYGVMVPDLPGCFSVGDSIEEATLNAHEAIECHLGGMLSDNDPIPLTKPIEHHRANPEYKDGVLVIVEIDISDIQFQLDLERDKSPTRDIDLS